ncbi:TIGR02221 family CRISPR-associated protein [Picosynechococcus sp. NKBG042902]|uniref:TIGR02221 family CRISPR-associated protein n=1 Tax=Picosynechococcus sp. NKBG042902 TaxID=490193 RepID=UPI0004AABB55|nr:TIGR02221 family CRISPR-associated protein [Picosynechococcus sp. NKBG042902]
MAKILISPVGVGGRFKNPESLDREYQEAQYRIDGKEYTSRFTASALCQHFQLDGIIFIGTVRSMWEEVYRYFSEEVNLRQSGNQIQFDEDYWYSLATQIDGLDHRSDLSELDLARVNEVLGDRSKCILVKYGLDNEELWNNFNLIFEIINFLDDGDEIYIDITHSFRSLPLFLFLIINFIKDLPREKNIHIAGIYYGMVDVVREMQNIHGEKFAPIVNLQPFFDLTEWIKGSYIFNTYGDGKLIANLLKEQSPEISANIQDLSEAINMGMAPAIRKQATALQKNLNAENNEVDTTKLEQSPFKYIKADLESTCERFVKRELECQFQLRLADWYFQNGRYSSAYLYLAESLVTYACEKENSQRVEADQKSLYSEEFRDKNKREYIYRGGENRYGNFDRSLSKLYNKVSKIRNRIAHVTLNPGAARVNDAIEKWQDLYQEASRIFNKF